MRVVQMKRPTQSKLHAPLLTHMRNVAYAPVVLPVQTHDDNTALAAAKLKREMRAAKRAKVGV